MYFRKNILEMSEYKPPLSGRVSSGKMLLDFNERTDPLPLSSLTELENWTALGITHRYPEYGELTELLAEYAEVAPENILFGNGSDQILDCVFRAVVDPKDTVVLPTPSFAMYIQFAQLADAELQSYDLLSEDPVSELEQELKKNPRLVVLCQPNNPTGTMLPKQEVIRFLEEYPDVWFLVDEAYFEFSQETLVQTPFQKENLIVTRTFSKAFGLAGLRFGYMVGSKEMVSQCSKIRGPYDVNQMSAYSAQVVLKNRKEILSYAEDVMNNQKPKVEEYLKEKGLHFLESSANYLLLTRAPEGMPEFLNENGILTRKMSQPNLKGAIRISIGGEACTKEFIGVLDKFFCEKIIN